MTIQIDEIFKAKGASVFGFLSEPGQGCYVPIYQRPYAWDKKNVNRLFEDVINGLNHLMDRDNAVSFLGTVIAIHDSNLDLVQPVIPEDVPSRVLAIIDGQQRISTLAMVNIALHGLIRNLRDSIAAAEGAEFNWLRDRADVAIADLWQTFVSVMSTGDPLYVNYPRVTRAGDDVWSRRLNTARYQSPIARLIWTYVEHVHQHPEQTFTYQPPNIDGVPDALHQPIADVYDHIASELTRITGSSAARYEFPEVQRVLERPGYIHALWSFPAPTGVIHFGSDGRNSDYYERYLQLIRSLLFYRYLLYRVALTVVRTRSEDDAFDMFEALNTTGEPLTAYETFRPKVIEAETTARFERSRSATALQRVDKYLEVYKKADDRQQATSDMLIPYALAQTGKKLPKALNDQRRYLRDTFTHTWNTLEEKRRAVESMAHLAAFLQTGWRIPLDDEPRIEGAPAFDALTGFAFQALRHLKHDVTIAPLSRFYDVFRSSDPAEREGKAQELFAAIQVTAAFSMLWRGAHGGTANIDSIYRKVMSDGDHRNHIPPLAVRTARGNGQVSLDNYRRVLRETFFRAFPNKEEWVSKASNVPIYGFSGAVARFLLIAASHDRDYCS